MTAWTSGDGPTPGEAARALADHPWLDRVARLGIIASGLLHLVLGWLAARVALGTGNEEAVDHGSALAVIRDGPFGQYLLWACVIGFGALALVRLLEGTLGGTSLAARGRSLSKAGLYVVLGVMAVRVALGGRLEGEGAATNFTESLLSAPWGRALVGLLAGIILGVGIYHVHKGFARRFTKDLRVAGYPVVGQGMTVLGTIGYVTKGVALIVVGGLFTLAAWSGDAGEAGGLDGAIDALSDTGTGTSLLLVISVGLVLYGIYTFARARYERFSPAGPSPVAERTT
ncbi:DUF1206 domain-containing protein [Ornithinimicrobium sp. Y1694]|uniref:DUF1206 domain-containing protein n=1 Tax=Ornithinimicrobium sp. Y1694 TaxID=3418590 RepID=UPI003CF79F71